MQQITAVLFSGGLDSAVLLARAAKDGPVQPSTSRVGLAWEADERRDRRALLVGARRDRQRAAAGVACASTCATSIRRRTGPSAASRRRSTRRTKTSTSTAATSSCCRRRRSSWRARRSARVCIGPLAGNPFPDATPRFFEAMAQALSLGLAQPDRDRGAVRLTCTRRT